MTLTTEQVKAIQRGGIDWFGVKLKEDGDYGPRTQWWDGILSLPLIRQQIIRTALKYNGTKEDAGRPNRSAQIDKWQNPGGLGVGNPWCIAFAMGVLREVGACQDWPYHTSAYEFMRWAGVNGLITRDPLPGDCFAFVYDLTAVGQTPGHGGIVLATDVDWMIDVDGNVGDSVVVGKRARDGITYIRTVPDVRHQFVMPPTKDFRNLDGARTR